MINYNEKDYDRDITKDLVGKKIQHIYFNEDFLRLVTDDGTFTYGVDADCCSTSLFYDFFGVKKLLENGPVVSVSTVDLHPTDIEKDDKEYGYMKDKKGEDLDIEVYGYSIVTEHPEFGEQTSVFSFRNYSNGYYGGSLAPCADREVQPEIFDDVMEAAEPVRE